MVKREEGGISGEEALDLFLKIGLDERTAKNTIANNKVTANLKAVIHEAAVTNGCDRAVGNLLYTVATKFPSNALVHRPILLKYIVLSKVKSPAQLEAAFSFFAATASDSFKIDDFEAACGVETEIGAFQPLQILQDTEKAASSRDEELTDLHDEIDRLKRSCESILELVKTMSFQHEAIFGSFGEFRVRMTKDIMTVTADLARLTLQLANIKKTVIMAVAESFSVIRETESTPMTAMRADINALAAQVSAQTSTLKELDSSVKSNFKKLFDFIGEVGPAKKRRKFHKSLKI